MAYGLKRRRGKGRRTKRSRKNFSRRVRRIVYSVAEKKYYEFAFNPANGTSCPDFSTVSSEKLAGGWGNQVSLLGAMPQGNGEGQRIGNKIRVKYVQLSTAFAMINQPNAGGTAGTTTTQASNLMGMFCRYMVLLDRQPGGTPCPRQNMNASDTLTFNTGTGAAANNIAISGDPLNFRDFNLLKRFKVKMDKQHNSFTTSTGTTPSGGVGPSTGARIEQHYLPFKNREFTYTSNTATTNLKTAAAYMQNGDIIYQAAPMDTACCINMVKVRVCYTDA